jgi:all-trans-retinol 13,14-reductase
MHCLLYGVTPEEAPFSLHAFVVGSYYESVNGIKGGGASLVGAFAAQLKKLGVDIFCGSEAKEIFLKGDNSISGVRYGQDNVLYCQSCISTIHPQTLVKIVPDSAFRSVYRKRVQSLEETCSAFIVYAKSSLPLTNLNRTNFFLFPGIHYNNHQDNGPVEEKTVFITHAKPNNKKTNQDGCIIICPAPNLGSEFWTTSYQPNNPDIYYSLKDTLSNRIIAHVEASYPELKGNLTRVDCATPVTLSNFTNSPFGSLYGIKHRIDQHNPLPLTKIKNLFLAGQSIIAPGVYGATVSGFIACGSILGHDAVIKELRKCI